MRWTVAVLPVVVMLVGCESKGEDSAGVAVGSSGASSDGDDGDDGGDGEDGGDGADGDDGGASDGGDGGSEGGDGGSGDDGGEGSDGESVPPCEPTANAWPDDVEIETRADVDRLCNGSYDSVEGDLAILGDDLSGPLEIDCITKVCGGLDILQSGVGPVSMPGLVEVGGDIIVQRNEFMTTLDLSDLELVHGEIGITGLDRQGVEVLRLPSLRRAERFSVSQAVYLRELDLNSLEHVTGEFDATDTDLTELQLPELAFVGGDFTVHGVWYLTEFSAPKLAHTGGLTFRDVRRLESLELPVLESVGDLRLSENREMRSASFPSLRTSAAEVLVTNHEALVSVDLGRLETVGDEVGFCHNEVLDSVDVDSLREVSSDLSICNHDRLDDVSSFHGVSSVGGDLRITDNSQLSSADAEALRDAIGTENIGGSVWIEGNGG